MLSLFFMFVCVHVSPYKDDDFPPRDDFSDADQLRVGNDGIFMLAFFSKFVSFCLAIDHRKGIGQTFYDDSEVLLDGTNRSSVGWCHPGRADSAQLLDNPQKHK